MKWIDRNDRLPPLGIRVLVARSRKMKTSDHIFCSLAERTHEEFEWVDEDGEVIESKYGIITHWAFIPDLPETQEKVLDNSHITKEEYLEAISEGVDKAFSYQIPSKEEFKDIFYNSVRNAHLDMGCHHEVD